MVCTVEREGKEGRDRKEWNEGKEGKYGKEGKGAKEGKEGTEEKMEGRGTVESGSMNIRWRFHTCSLVVVGFLRPRHWIERNSCHMPNTPSGTPCGSVLNHRWMFDRCLLD